MDSGSGISIEMRQLNIDSVPLPNDIEQLKQSLAVAVKMLEQEQLRSTELQSLMEETITLLPSEHRNVTEKRFDLWREMKGILNLSYLFSSNLGGTA